MCIFIYCIRIVLDSNSSIEINQHSLIDTVSITKPPDDPLYMDWDNAFSELSTSVKFSNQNASLSEIQPQSLVSKPKLEKKSTYQLNDVILVETDKNSSISDVCDALFAENGNIKNEKPIDIQIMLAESSDLESSDNKYPAGVDTYSLLSKIKSKDFIKSRLSSLDPSRKQALLNKYDNLRKLADSDNFDARIFSSVDNELLFLNLSKSGEYYVTTESNEEEILGSTDSNLIKTEKETRKNKISSIFDKSNSLLKVQSISNIITTENYPNSFIINEILPDTDKLDIVNSFNVQDQNNILNLNSVNTQQYKTNLPFLHWLSSVTEQINQTMHFQFNGTAKSLSYQIPQVSKNYIIKMVIFKTYILFH